MICENQSIEYIGWIVNTHALFMQLNLAYHIYTRSPRGIANAFWIMEVYRFSDCPLVSACFLPDSKVVTVFCFIITF